MSSSGGKYTEVLATLYNPRYAFMSSGGRNWTEWKGAPRWEPLGAQSDYWFPTLRSRPHSHVATILCSIRLSCRKKDDLACFANQAISKHNTRGVESRPVPECLQGVTGWQPAATNALVPNRLAALGCFTATIPVCSFDILICFIPKSGPKSPPALRPTRCN